uniref:Uncharacterized protein n=1 Tax=Bionectria ochroleuca TaxID=29856 RepID=A0A8H7TLM8_BIOOC
MASPAVPSTSSPAHESLVDEASNRAFTSHRSAEEQDDEYPCPWRTSLYYDEECSRYFDCPSHGIERRLSVDEQPASADIETRNHSGIHASSTETGGASLASGERRPGERSALNSGSHQHQDTTSAAPSRLNMEISGLSSSAPTASLLHVGAEFGEPSGSQSGVAHDANASLASQHIPRDHSGEHGQGHPDLDRFRALDMNAVLNMPLPETQQGEPSIPLPIQDEEIDAQHGGSESVSSDFALPRWQPDAEVTSVLSAKRSSASLFASTIAESVAGSFVTLAPHTGSSYRTNISSGPRIRDTYTIAGLAHRSAWAWVL